MVRPQLCLSLGARVTSLSISVLSSVPLSCHLGNLGTYSVANLKVPFKQQQLTA